MPRTPTTTRRHPASLRVEFAGVTDIGRVRNENQDAIGKFPDGPFDPRFPAGQLFIVADGMGGHLGGRTASALAVRTVADRFLAAPSDHPAHNLLLAVAAANEAIYDRGSVDPSLAGMGTTCTALVLKGNRVCIAHVGDSRAYRVLKTRIEQLTDDHSRVAELVRAGIITRDQARVHPERAFLSRALGTRPEVEIDVLENIPASPGSWLVLCSDGLTGMVADEEIHTTVVSLPPADAARALVALANERGGYDNITVMVIRIARARRTKLTRRTR